MTAPSEITLATKDGQLLNTTDEWSMRLAAGGLVYSITVENAMKIAEDHAMVRLDGRAVTVLGAPAFNKLVVMERVR